MTEAPATAGHDALFPDVQEWRAVSRQLVAVRRAGALAFVTVLAVAVAVVLGIVVAAWVSAVAVGVGICAAVFAWIVVGRACRSWGYSERDDDLLVRHGLLVRRLSVVPYGRMQFVDVTAGPLERRLGIATVHLHTAAAASDAVIPGLPTAEAGRLRDRLAALGESRAAGL